MRQLDYFFLHMLCNPCDRRCDVNIPMQLKKKKLKKQNLSIMKNRRLQNKLACIILLNVCNADKVLSILNDVFNLFSVEILQQKTPE